MRTRTLCCVMLIVSLALIDCGKKKAPAPTADNQTRVFETKDGPMMAVNLSPPSGPQR